MCQPCGTLQAADRALAEAGKSRPKVRPINPKEAARGKVDYVQVCVVQQWCPGLPLTTTGNGSSTPHSNIPVLSAQVKDWANGQAADIGELQVVAGSVGTGYSTGSSSTTAAAADAATPFYQQLGQHAQYLEVGSASEGTCNSLGRDRRDPKFCSLHTSSAQLSSANAATHAHSGPSFTLPDTPPHLLLYPLRPTQRQGVLSIANKPGAKPYLPFEAWQYSLRRYSQYVAELAAVHVALEGALQLALAPPTVPGAAQTVSSQEDIALPPSGSSTNEPGWAVPGREHGVLQAYTALQCFGPDSGLWRAAAAQADLQALAVAAAQQDGSSMQAAQQQHGSSSALELQASQNAVAYGRYLLQLGRAAAAATEAAAAAADPGSDGLVAEEAEGAVAALKLLAHAYGLQVQQQCLGTRIGAAATDKLQLLPARAVALYMDYPRTIVGEPVQQLMQVTDAAGRVLDAAGRQAVLDELPKALKKSALMLAPLATAE